MELNDSSFTFVGNNLAVDFVNTEVFSRGLLIDLLKNRDDLTKWAKKVSLNLESKLSTSDFARVIKLRMALRDVFAANINSLPIPQAALIILNKQLANYCKPMVLCSDKNELILQQTEGELTISKFMSYIAYEGARLLASPQAKRLKRCSNQNCVLIFLDTSRNQKRRWCSMDTCGNRAKVSTHYKKQQS